MPPRIEMWPFPVEIARLSLLIAEFQCDARLINQQVARLNVLPLHRTGQIHIGNALRLDWLKICPPAIQMERQPTDLFDTPPRQAEIDFEAKEVETYICGNPQYKGSQDQSERQKADLRLAFEGSSISTGAADYVLAWFAKGRNLTTVKSRLAFVTTNSVHQGRQVARFRPFLLD